jgi:hypothetical protein
MRRKEELLFGKKKQNLLSFGVCVAATRTPTRKSFLVLFFKKERLAYD